MQHAATSGKPKGQAILATIDARTNLAGTNKMELLLFRVGTPETYGINVFKVKEIIRSVAVTCAPSQPDHVEGLASIRGQLVPVIDLISICGGTAPTSPPLMILTEFSHSIQAFLVEAVETIVRADWSDVHQPPNMLSANSRLTGVTRLPDGRLVSILDVELMLHGLSGAPDLIDAPYFLEPHSPISPDIKLFCVDDSAFARSQLKQILDKIGVQSEFAINGMDAWKRLDAIANRAEALSQPLADTMPLIITDIEMPEMDGFMLTRTIKADRRFKGVKVLLHSSMSESSNMEKGLAQGADGYLPKYKAAEVAKGIEEFLTQCGKTGAPET
jgi:two-component system chemotaxis response regulator CheV